MMVWELQPAYVGWLSVLLIGGYTLVAWQDLRRREIDLWPLLVLAVGGLVGHTAWWWIFLAVLYAWPWRKETATLLIPVLFVIGWVTGELAPVLALTAGILAWSLGWWGGADSVLLATLALRYGTAGLVVGATTSALFGVLFLLARRQLLRLVPALTDVLAARNVVDLAAPPGSADTEMPAATALGAAGLILEVWSW
jgi:Flp pilus assembly protein protease CpaA